MIDDVKKVLYVLDNFPKLSETFVLNELVALRKREIDVSIWAFRKSCDRIVNADFVHFGLNRCTYYIRSLIRLRILTNWRFYMFGIKLALIFFRGESTFFIRASEGRRLIAIKRMYELCTAACLFRNADIIHAHFAARASYFAVLLGKLIGTPVTITAHAYEIFISPDIPFLRHKFNGATRIITPSEYNRNFLEDIVGVVKDRIDIVRATIDLEKFPLTPVRQRMSNTLRVCAVGRLVEKKGFEFLIRAVGEAIQAGHEILLSIIGDGPEHKHLINLIDELGLYFNVHLLGSQSNEFCSHLLQKSDVSVLPCVVAKNGDRDVCPLSLQEAMAVGIPVISTGVGSIPELIQDGISGLLVPERNVKMLSAALIRLSENEQLRLRLREGGRKRAEEEYNINTQIEKLLSIWRQLIHQVDS